MLFFYFWSCMGRLVIDRSVYHKEAPRCVNTGYLLLSCVSNIDWMFWEAPIITSFKLGLHCLYYCLYIFFSNFYRLFVNVMKSFSIN